VRQVTWGTNRGTIGRDSGGLSVPAKERQRHLSGSWHRVCLQHA